MFPITSAPADACRDAGEMATHASSHTSTPIRTGETDGTPGPVEAGVTPSKSKSVPNGADCPAISTIPPG